MSTINIQFFLPFLLILPTVIPSDLEIRTLTSTPHCVLRDREKTGRNLEFSLSCVWAARKGLIGAGVSKVREWSLEFWAGVHLASVSWTSSRMETSFCLFGVLFILFLSCPWLYSSVLFFFFFCPLQKEGLCDAKWPSKISCLDEREKTEMQLESLKRELSLISLLKLSPLAARPGSTKCGQSMRHWWCRLDADGSLLHHVCWGWK